MSRNHVVIYKNYKNNIANHQKGRKGPILFQPKIKKELEKQLKTQTNTSKH